VTNFEECKRIALGLEEAEDAVATDEFPPVDHHDSEGNFSGKVLESLAKYHELGAYYAHGTKYIPGRATKLLEMLCKVFNASLCGVIWRTGAVPLSGVDKTSKGKGGHWLAASHIPGTNDWEEHRWWIKDSMKPEVKGMDYSANRICSLIEKAAAEMNDWFILIDLKRDQK